MQPIQLSLPGLLLFQPEIHRDGRGWFVETWQNARYSQWGLPAFVQDNLVHSTRNVLRGMHFQVRHPQAKLIQVLTGRVQDVVVCMDVESSFYLAHCCVELDAEKGEQLFVPAGYAHGYRVLSDTALVSYKCSDYYAPNDQAGLRWNDPKLKLPWRLDDNLIINERDNTWPLL